ncbi:MAG: hypothetical protein ACP5QA_16750 [Phycisphaerae bacterium]
MKSKNQTAHELSEQDQIIPEKALRRAIHNSGYDRKERDFYATPAWVTEALLRHIKFRGPIWEPCCGTGAMSTVLIRHGYEVKSTDIADRGFGTAGIDFMSCIAVPSGCRTIITNPPYGDTGSHTGQEKSSHAMLDFVRHALALSEATDGQLALLVRLQWIAGKRAADLMSAARFCAVITLTKRIQWFDMGDKTNSAQHHHAWVVFDQRYPKGKPPSLLFAGVDNGNVPKTDDQYLLPLTTANP